MARPPQDVDPEKFVIGGDCHNVMTVCPYNDNSVFRINPAPIPLSTIIVFNAVMIVFFIGWSVGLKFVSHNEAPIWAFVMGFVILLTTCVLGTVMFYHEFKSEQQQGSCFVYEKATRKVHLPRENITFEPEDVIHLQYITTKTLPKDGVVDYEPISELNLITRSGGVKKRWNLLRSTDPIFDSVVKSIIKNTQLPVVRIKDDFRGWRVTETPFT